MEVTLLSILVYLVHKLVFFLNENLEDSDCFRLRKKPICVLNKPESKVRLLQLGVCIF